LLSVAGRAGVEDAYTELIGWMLNPPGHPWVALRCQRALLNTLKLDGKTLVEPVRPQTQFVTANSRPDLVMHFEQLEFVLVVEAKTRSDEHETHGGVMQTVAYADDVLRTLGLATLGLAPIYRAEIAYLTPSGVDAENPKAIPITYLDLVGTFGLELRPDELPADLRWSYATIFTHFLASAAPDGVDVAEALRRVSDTASGSKKTLDEGTILSNLGGFGPMARLVQREMTT
jgi:hypothetical protein